MQVKAKPIRSNNFDKALYAGDGRDLPKPVRPATASAVLRRRNGKTTELKAARKTRKRVARWK
jgi:hypothetical protein